MRNGPLRHRITLQSLSHVQDANTGEMVPVWADWPRPGARHWARIEPLSGRDFIAAKAVQSEVTARVVLRYLDGIDATMRMLYRGKVYSIHAPLPDAKSGREYLTLMVSEGVKRG